MLFIESVDNFWHIGTLPPNSSNAWSSGLPSNIFAMIVVHSEMGEDFHVPKTLL